MSIVERDISFYESEIEYLRYVLRNCAPQDEERISERIESAISVVGALRRHAKNLGIEITKL